MEKYLKYIQIVLQFVPKDMLDQLIYNFLVKCGELVENSENTLDDQLLLPIIKKLKSGFTNN